MDSTAGTGRMHQAKTNRVRSDVCSTKADGTSKDTNNDQVLRPNTTNVLHHREKRHYYHLQQEFEGIERKLKDPQEKLCKAEAEKEYWADRMSKVTGDKLTRDNPDIADLSDPKRPHKLGEKYSQLYDDEWTDAMGKITGTNETESSERRGIDILVDILRRSHDTCIKLADVKMQNLQRAVILERSMEQNGVMNCPIDVQRSLKHVQTLASLLSLSEVQKNVRRQLTSFKEKFDDLPLDQLTSFVDKCTEICWGMVMQSPRMDFLFPKEGHGMRFNKDEFNEFTRSGDTLDFVVWPAMVIQKQGSLLVKGTVQPIAKQK